MLIRLINIGLRGSTLVSKFLLIFLLARFLEPGELGLYGLLTVTISYGLYFLGLDFYIFTTREILKASSENRGRLLKSQFFLSLALYATILPLSVCLFLFGLLPWWVMPWFLALLVLEHITQELNRLLVTLSRQLVASCVLFFRAGAWCLAVVGLMYLDTDQRNLKVVLAAWIIGSSVAMVIGICVISRAGMQGWRQSIDWPWLRRGLTVALPMLLATLALRGIYTFDRYGFEFLAGLDVLGAYVLYIGICNALVSFMDAAVFTFLYPVMISANADKDSELFRKTLRQLALQTTTLTLVFSITAWIASGPLLQWIDRPLYTEYRYLLPFLLVANALFVISTIPHLGLYTRGFDRPIIISHVLGLSIFLLSTFILSFFVDILAVPISLIFAFGSILILKTWQFYRLTPLDWR